MNAIRGRVHHGRIELDSDLPEGTEVVVLPVGADEPLDLDEAQLAELEERVTAAERGETEPARTVFERIRRRR